MKSWSSPIPSGQGFGIVTTVAQFQFLAQKLMQAVDVAKK